MKRPTVHNKRTLVSMTDAVYIGRPSIWGNPFVIIDGRSTRDQVILEYREWILKQPHLLARLPELAGKRLICWCAPKACHGDVLADLVEALEEPE